MSLVNPLIAKAQEVKDLVLSLPAIGVYIKPNGFEFPAVWVGSNAPLEFKTEGIEVLIDHDRVKPSTPVGSPRSLMWSNSVTISAIQHDVGEYSTESFLVFQHALIVKLRPAFYAMETLKMPGSNLVLEEFRVTGYYTEIFKE